jgi:hypothetical protein
MSDIQDSTNTATSQGGAQPGGDFVGSLPENLRGEGSLKNFKDAGALAQSYVELRRTFSSRSMADMDAPADDKGRAAVLTKLGAAPPAKPDDYKLPNNPSAKQFGEWAHKTGLTVKQAETLYGEMDGATTRATEERKTRMVQRAGEYKAALTQEWGADYDSNAALATRGMEHYVPDKDLRDMLIGTGIGQHPIIAKLFQQLGRSLKEGTMLPGSGVGGTGGAGTVESAQNELDKFQKDNRTLIYSQNDMNPEVRAAKTHRSQLLENLARLKLAAKQG